ncbi:MAG: hypothetical protein CSA66_08150 [Proteobacteria bacterium]|nr:MAG: hypothetical protein CSA66_08150 [Pseudomonadota bacterium]
MMLGTSATAFGIDLRNEDPRPYNVEVTSSAMTKEVSLAGKSLSIVVCVGQCSFYVPGVGRISAGGSDVVTIRHGRLIKKEVPMVAQP